MTSNGTSVDDFTASLCAGIVVAAITRYFLSIINNIGVAAEILGTVVVEDHGPLARDGGAVVGCLPLANGSRGNQCRKNLAPVGSHRLTA